MASKIRKRVNKKITRALREYQMIQAGDCVVLGLSGGVDSLALLYELAGRRSLLQFELICVFIRSDFATDHSSEFLQSLCNELHVPFRCVDVAVKARLQPGRKLNCYWCSMQRRTELLQFAMANGCNKLALGHHMDDIAETLLMNLLYEGRFDGMPPVVVYNKYPLQLIRPLLYVEKSEIECYIQEHNVQAFTCTCTSLQSDSSGGVSHRVQIRSELQQLTGGSSAKKAKIIQAARSTGWNGACIIPTEFTH